MGFDIVWKDYQRCWLSQIIYIKLLLKGSRGKCLLQGLHPETCLQFFWRGKVLYKLTSRKKLITCPPTLLTVFQTVLFDFVAVSKKTISVKHSYCRRQTVCRFHTSFGNWWTCGIKSWFKILGLYQRLSRKY